jgi:hypothetical protein
LTAYLALEREMLGLDSAGDPLADRLRDAMDPLWYALTDEEHATLDARIVVAESSGSLVAFVDCFTTPPETKELTPRTEPYSATNWEYAA